jgi:hypothetical protein
MINVRDIRTSFLEKRLDYACSIDGESFLDTSRTVSLAEGVRVTLLGPSAFEQEGPDLEVFHVRGLRRVMASDGKGHDAPLGIASAHEQGLLFSCDEAGALTNAMSGSVDGRMTIEPTAEPVQIDVVYRGVLQLTAHPSAIFADDHREGLTIHGQIFIRTTFETLHPKYHWLTERVCVAFGTWTASACRGPIRRVRQSYDLYSTG